LAFPVLHGVLVGSRARRGRRGQGEPVAPGQGRFRREMYALVLARMPLPRTPFGENEWHRSGLQASQLLSVSGVSRD